MLESRLSLISQQVMSSINQTFMSVIWLRLLSKKINSTFFFEIPTREKTLPNISTKKNWFANFVWNIWNLFKNLFKVQWFSWWNDGKKDKSYSKAGVWCDSGVTVVWQWCHSCLNSRSWLINVFSRLLFRWFQSWEQFCMEQTPIENSWIKCS